MSSKKDLNAFRIVWVEWDTQLAKLCNLIHCILHLIGNNEMHLNQLSFTNVMSFIQTLKHKFLANR